MQRFVMVVIIWLSSVLLYPQLGKTADESLPCTPDMHLLYGDTVICDIRPTGDSASFVFNAEPGDSILLQTTRLSGSLRPCLTLITPDNTHQDACNNAAMNRLQTTLQKGGEYVVRVEDGFIHGTGDFTLALERTFPPPPSATPMQYGDIKTDAIVPRGAIKVFVFRGMSGDTILLQATRLNGSLRPCLTLIAPDNTRQDVCNNSARNRLESTLEQAGDYTVVIADGFIYGTGDFELSLACLVGSCVPGPPGHGESDNRPPVAKAGSDQSVTTGALVTLDGSGSRDDDGDTLTYNWVFVSIPDDSTATLSDPTSEAPTLLTDVDGAYVIHLIVNDGKIDSAPDTVTIFARISPSVIYMLYGINFGPYIDGQDPNRGAVVSEAQLQERMEVIAPYTEWIRCFGSSNGLEKCGLVAHRLGLKAAIGAWLSRDLAANEREISNVIAAAKVGQADMIVVGNEVLLRKDLTEEQLIGYIERIKGETPGIPVTTAEVYFELLAHPAVVAAVDVVLFNAYPYWEGISVEHAVAALHGWHQQIVSTAGEKQVILSETGWPSCGDQIGDAVASPENASFYFLNLISWARANAAPYFYFEALDETWKAAYEGPQGACWGMWTKDGSLKPGMQDVFDGHTIPDNWSGAETPGGPGEPTIEFTSVPPMGSFEDLQGQVSHVRPADYNVAVYIQVRGRWWTKPFFNRPLTTTGPDGRWTTDITTGGVDQTATAIVAYLVPAGYNPPLARGVRTLAPELDEHALAKVETVRAP